MRIYQPSYRSEERRIWREIWREEAQRHYKRGAPEQCHEIHEQAHEFFLRAGEEAMERMRQQTPPTKEAE